MEKTFTRKKGETWDGDEDFIHYIEDNLLNEGENGWYQFKKDYKITIKIEVNKY